MNTNEILKLLEANKPQNKNKYIASLKQAILKLSQLGDFNYNANSDPQYKKHAHNMKQQGKLAMKDSLGEATSLTGGYLNSYAQGLAQQRYNQNLNKIDDIIPKLYGMAFDRFKQKGDSLKGNVDMYKKLSDTENANFQKVYMAWQKDRDYYLKKKKQEESLALANARLQEQSKRNAGSRQGRGKRREHMAGGASTAHQIIKAPISTYEKLLRRFERKM